MTGSRGVKRLFARPDWCDRNHFFSTASRVMRRILVDYARRHGPTPRGGGAVGVNLEESALGLDGRAEMLLPLGEALERLQVLEERLARTAECRLLGGLTQAQTAGVLGLGVRTLRRDWIKRVRGCTASRRAVDYRVSQYPKVLSIG